MRLERRDGMTVQQLLRGIDHKAVVFHGPPRIHTAAEHQTRADLGREARADEIRDAGPFAEIRLGLDHVVNLTVLRR